MQLWHRAALATYYVRRAFEHIIPLKHPVSATVSQRWGYLLTRTEFKGRGTVATVHVTVRTWHPGFWWLAAGWLMDGDDDGGQRGWLEMLRRAAAWGVNEEAHDALSQ